MSNEWFTPVRYIESARAVMGGIDLDPASCAAANQIVKATCYYTKEQDGLTQVWYGRVWCNPPYNPTKYCRFPQPTWARRVQQEYRSGNIEQAILLVSPNTKQVWFHELMDYPMCFMTERIFFLRPDKEPEELRHGNIAVYFGPNERKFIEVFSRFGRVTKAIDTFIARPANLELWRMAESEVPA